jgi:hypothetical protein
MAPLPLTESPELTIEQSEEIRDLLRNTLGINKIATSHTIHKLKKQKTQKDQIDYMGNFVHDAIIAQIDEYRNQSFAKFGLEIAVYPPKSAEHIVHPFGTFGEVIIGYVSYSFRHLHNEEPTKKLPVRITRGTVLVFFCHSWQPVSAYLDGVGTDRTKEQPRHLQLDQQYHWWRSNGKSFNISKLPGELRNAIFDCVLPHETRPFLNDKCRKRGPIVPTFKYPCTALMLTNKQMHREATDSFYHMTTFLIEHRQLFDKTFNKYIIKARLRHARLDLTHWGYLSLFQFQHKGLSSKPFTKYQLREMSDVTRLEINIQPPSRIAEKTWLEGACQKTVVHIIFEVAWPSIKGLPVTFTGYIKDSQKKAFEAHLKAERDSYEIFKACCLGHDTLGSLHSYDDFVRRTIAEEQGGVRLDGKPWEDQVEEVQGSGLSAQDLEIALECECELECTLEGWNQATDAVKTTVHTNG